jgi:hypothetical protein
MKTHEVILFGVGRDFYVDPPRVIAATGDSIRFRGVQTSGIVIWPFTGEAVVFQSGNPPASIPVPEVKEGVYPYAVLCASGENRGVARGNSDPIIIIREE